jgi:hypothetical protein
VRATLIGGPFHRVERDVEDDPPDVVLCTDDDDATLEHLYRLRGVEQSDEEEQRAVYEYAPEVAHAGP